MVAYSYKSFSQLNLRVADLIKTPQPNDVLIYFGVGEISARTAKKIGLTNWSVDKDPSLWGGSHGRLKDIGKPQSIEGLAHKAKVVICSA